MTSQIQIDYLLNKADPSSITRYLESCLRKFNQFNEDDLREYVKFEESDPIFLEDLEDTQDERLISVMKINCMMDFLTNLSYEKKKLLLI